MTAFARRDIYASAAVALAASLWLLALTSTYRIDRFYVAGQTLMSNDQVGYLTSARWLAETGELRSHLIFPAHVREPRWRLYMPGHYFTLAAGHVLFGDGPIAWRMPALVSFVLSAVGVFLIGLRFFDRASGAVAALLFILFPMMNAFAFTAMPQLPFTAACVAAFCIFAWLPERLRLFFMPALLAGPFLFRETGAFLVIPMALVSLMSGGQRRWAGTLAAVLGSVLVLYALLAWQIDSGKSSLPLDGSRFNYDNAFPPNSSPAAIEERLKSLGENVSRNVASLARHAERHDAVFVTLAAMSLLAIAALARGIRDPLALGSALLFLTMLVVMTVFYTWAFFRGVRALLFTFPFLAVSVAPVLTILKGRLWVIPAIVLAALSYLGNARLGSRIEPDAGMRAVERLESLRLDDEGLMIGPTALSLDYVLRRYPLRWSFIPANDETLTLLAETHPVGTIILRESDLRNGRRITERAIEHIGLVRSRTFQHGPRGDEETYVIFEAR